ncbi:hypothetical protein GCM10023172_22530 [Hymenobacter ginsengisoli]|uniref:Nitrile hydratase beta subunit domain-containing protein n=1 Tax=Hymenobacter ginsengisoli TaxID=1051626 RepID=A0ABP8QCS4_9BACT|nr:MULTISPECIES: hypothetical protein [unclassified Hymenobacter]MBO2031983.1 hypothetical protein [Hymenobacter sp. BT559]
MIQAPDKLPLPPSWRPLTTARAQLLLAELRAELRAGHVLHGVPVHAVAEAVADDDVLFRHCNDPVRFTVVHLTYRGQPEPDPRSPAVRVDGSWLEFMAEQRLQC